MEYQEFLDKKSKIMAGSGVDVTDDQIHPILFPFQRDLTRFALRKGRAAIFADTGLGKSFMQVEWSRLSDQTTLIVAPLSVARQTVREASKIGVDVRYVRDDSDLAKINITNYEMLKHFDPTKFGAVALDESSILKGMDSTTRSMLINMFSDTPFRLCCTATPAPNDISEIANHAEFLGIMSRAEMLATFFVHDDNGWRLKGHAESNFYRWLASWGMSIRKPSDLGYSDDGYILPALEMQPIFIDTDYRPEGELFFGGLKGIGDRSKVRKETLGERVKATVELVANDLEVMIRYSNELSSIEVTDVNQDRIQQGLQQSLLRGEQREGEGTRKKILPRDERREGQREETPSVEGMAGEKQRSSSRIQGKDKGQKECQEAGTVCSGRESSNRGKKKSSAVATGKQGKAKGSTTKTLSDKPRRISSNARKTEPSMPDMRALGYEQSEHIPSSRPLPQNEEGSRAFVSELQPSSGQDEGQPGTTEGCNRLFGNQWIIWCGLNDEQKAICDILDKHHITYVSVEGGLSLESKVERVDAFLNGSVQVIVSKPKVLGWGMNFQNAHKMAFVGLSDSWEAYYQCIRRCWRFGQKHPVNAYVVLSEAERQIWDNVQKKEQEAERMANQLVEHVKEFEKAEIGATTINTWEYQTDTVEGEDYKVMLGDSCERLGEIEDESVHLSVFSPPFMSLYTYSPTERDMGNCKDEEEFFAHFGFIIDHLLRITKPGRICAVHVAQVPAMIARDGYIGLKDFRGKTIQAFENHGWTFHRECCIDKDPQAQAIRTHSKALLFTQMKKDRSWSGPALADYILVFRKPGENEEPITGDLTNDEWIEWARPIWYGIRESDTLNFQEAREDKDERHICPLQLGTIERVIKLWSNPGELVCSPYTGIGSEGYQALKLGRRFVGCELKPSYFKVACKNLETAVRPEDQLVML